MIVTILMFVRHLLVSLYSRLMIYSLGNVPDMCFSAVKLGTLFCVCVFKVCHFLCLSRVLDVNFYWRLNNQSRKCLSCNMGYLSLKSLLRIHLVSQKFLLFLDTTEVTALEWCRLLSHSVSSARLIEEPKKLC